MTYRFQVGSARTLERSDDGAWFVDAEGRYALFRGVNFGSRAKLPPYLPTIPLHTADEHAFDAELALVKPRLSILRELGFNVARLLVIWKALEPQVNPTPDNLLPQGKRYLLKVRQVVDALYELGVFVIIDFHQDILNEAYGGEGFPDWALGIDRFHQPRPGFRVPSTWPLENQGELVRHTLTSFWRNDLTNERLAPSEAALARTVRTHAEKTLGATAGFLMTLTGGGHPGILGYEPFNEPEQAKLSRQDFERNHLPAYYDNALREIRRAGDSRSFVFCEPRVDWTTFDPGSFLPRILKPDEPITTWLDLSILPPGERLVFSAHYYDLELSVGLTRPAEASAIAARGPTLWTKRLAGIKQAAADRRLTPFLTEFGAGQARMGWTAPQTRAAMAGLFAVVEEHLLNSTYWNFDLYNTVRGGDNWNDEDFSLMGPDGEIRNPDLVARPYPMRSSARPTALAFDPGTLVARMEWSGAPVGEPTVIFIPKKLQYAGGFEVHATSAAGEWDADQSLLAWTPAPDAVQHRLVLFAAGKPPPPDVLQGLVPVVRVATS